MAVAPRFSSLRIVLVPTLSTLSILLMLSQTGCSHSPGRQIASEISGPSWTFDAARKQILQAPTVLELPPRVAREKWDLDWDSKKDQVKKNTTPQSLESVETIFIHNTETPEQDGRGLKRVISEHVGGRKWPDVGYHFLVARDAQDGHWKVYEGRPIDRVGAHAGILRDSSGKSSASLNPNTLGIAIVGSFSWKTEAKRKEMAENISSQARGTEAGEKQLEKLLVPYADPTSPEHLRQPSAEAVEVLLRLIDSLVQDSRFKGLKKIRAHGALAASELDPEFSEEQRFNFAINPYHTDCPGHGMLHVVEALQERYGDIFQKRSAERR